MNKMLIILGLVVLTSGCLGRGGETTTAVGSYGLVINEFEPDFADVEESDRLSIFLEVENTGGATANDVKALLHGIPIGKDPREFSLDFGEKLADLGDMDGPDEVNGIKGDVDRYEWRLTAPDVPSGIKVSYDPKIRLLYGYETVASAKIIALSEDEYRRLRTAGQALPSSGETIVSKGPLGVSVNVINQPAVIKDAGDDVNIQIELKLLEAGTVFDPDNRDYTKKGEVDIDDLDVVGVKISAPGSDSNEGQCAPLDKETFERLGKGSTKTISCELQPGSFVGVKEIPLTVKVRYNFLADKTTKVTISGTE